MYSKTISKNNDEFVVQLFEDDTTIDEEGPETSYVYCNIENKFGGDLTYLTIEDVKELVKNLNTALVTMMNKNKEIEKRINKMYHD